MMTVWQRVQAYCSSIRSPRPVAGHDVETPFPSSLQRRGEPRNIQRETCEFVLTHALDPSHLMIEEGIGVTLNVSRSGMQLLLDLAPPAGQLLEVHTGGGLQRSVSLMEVCWTKSVRDDAQGRFHIVGCRLTFGPRRYWAF